MNARPLALLEGYAALTDDPPATRLFLRLDDRPFLIDLDSFPEQVSVTYSVLQQWTEPYHTPQETDPWLRFPLTWTLNRHCQIDDPGWVDLLYTGTTELRLVAFDEHVLGWTGTYSYFGGGGLTGIPAYSGHEYFARAINVSAENVGIGPFGKYKYLGWDFWRDGEGSSSGTTEKEGTRSSVLMVSPVS